MFHFYLELLLLVTGHVCLNQLYFNTNFSIFHTFPSGIPESFQFIWNSTLFCSSISNPIAFIFVSNLGGNFSLASGIQVESLSLLLNVWVVSRSHFSLFENIK